MWETGTNACGSEQSNRHIIPFNSEVVAFRWVHRVSKLSAGAFGWGAGACGWGSGAWTLVISREAESADLGVGVSSLGCLTCSPSSDVACKVLLMCSVEILKTHEFSLD